MIKSQLNENNAWNRVNILFHNELIIISELYLDIDTLNNYQCTYLKKHSSVNTYWREGFSFTSALWMEIEINKYKNALMHCVSMLLWT